MIFQTEDFNELKAHPDPPRPGYISLYSYGGTLYLMRSNGMKYDLMLGSGSAGSLVLDPETSTFSGFSAVFTADENLIKGDVCRLSGSEMAKADADSIASSYAIAIATDTITSGNPGEFLLIGIIGGFSDLTPGSPIYLSTATGQITQTLVTGSADIVQILGVAISATHVYFKPEVAQLELL